MLLSIEKRFRTLINEEQEDCWNLFLFQSTRFLTKVALEVALKYITIYVLVYVY